MNVRAAAGAAERMSVIGEKLKTFVRSEFFSF
jgi:hypothetical protein